MEVYSANYKIDNIKGELCLHFPTREDAEQDRSKRRNEKIVSAVPTLVILAILLIVCCAQYESMHEWHGALWIAGLLPYVLAAYFATATLKTFATALRIQRTQIVPIYEDRL